MTTISHVCEQFFSQTQFANLEAMPCRGVRRNLARLLYRQHRRPGLVAPTGPGEKPVRVKHGRRARCVQRPMRHVYKLHEPKAPKKPISLSMIPRLGRPHRNLRAVPAE